MRFTNTWSPISSVFSIELDGISNACTTNVMMNSPVTSTAASDDRNSTVVSLGFSSAAALSTASSSFFFATIVFVLIRDGHNLENCFSCGSARHTLSVPVAACGSSA